LYYPLAITITHKKEVIGLFFCTSCANDTAGAKIGDFKVKYLREFEAICKKALTHGVQVGLFDGKKPEVGNLVTLSL
jgi:hypothetical protein